MAVPKRATPAQIINHLRKTEVELAAGKSICGADDHPPSKGRRHDFDNRCFAA